MNGIEFLCVFYVLPLLICLLGSWIGQITNDEDISKMFSIFTFIPMFNIMGAVIFIFTACVASATIILTLPTIIKELFKDK